MRELYTQHKLLSLAPCKKKRETGAAARWQITSKLITLFSNSSFSFLAHKRKHGRREKPSVQEGQKGNYIFLSCLSTRMGSTPGLGLAAPSDACDASPPSTKAACES